MIQLSVLRSEVIEQLRASLPNLEVDKFPNKPQDYILAHPNGAVLIAIDGVNFSEPLIEQQAYTVNLTATVLFRSTLENDYMLDALDAIREALTYNFYPYNMRFYCTSISVQGEEDNIWYYRLKFIFPGVIR